jgi:D-beta-D-heptose 7-phosphate kinase/D-beta-D-heptose 1-phosphate adenosyltransferase
VGRVLSPTSFVRAAAAVRKDGGRVVFTNGVFDLLHYGHVSYLQKARRLGDALFVALNSDRSTRRLKGAGRPYIELSDRMRTVAALACVDCVTHFDEATPARLIERLKPDVLVKGADYRRSEIVGAEAVRNRGGRVARIPLLEGRSTSRLARRIRRSP